MNYTLEQVVWLCLSNGRFFLDKYHSFSPKIMILSSRSSKYWLLNIWTLQIHLTMKFYWKRKSSDYTLRLQATINYISDCQQTPIHCNSCIIIFDPNFLGIDATYKKLSLHAKSIYERFSKNVYFNIITFSKIL
jgi:hypothetical protein